MNYITRAIARLRFTIASVMDRGVESLISDLAKMDSKLDAYANRAADRVAHLDEEIGLSHERQANAVAAERLRRADLVVAASTIETERERAQRIRAKIAALVE